MGWVPDDQSIINHWVDIPNSKNHVRVAHPGKNNQERFKRLPRPAPSRWCAVSWPDFAPQALWIAARTLAGVEGTERSLTPTASNTAFEMAEGTTAADGSPTPQGFSAGRSISSMSTSGISGKVKIG